MKIAFTVSQLMGTAGGAQKSVVELANEMQARGHKVTLVSFEPQLHVSGKPFYKVASGVDVRVVLKPQLTNRLHINKNDRPKEISDRVIDEFEWYASHKVTIVELADIIIDLRPDAVVSFLPSTFTTTALVLNDSGIPFVVANRNDPAWDYKKKRYMPNDYDVWLRKQAAQQATLNLVQIPAFIGYFSPKVQQKTRVIPNPVKSLPNSAAKQSNKENVIISVGRLEKAKNQELLVKAFSNIADEYSDWKVHIYGEGSERAALQALIDSLGLSDRAILKGVTSDIHKEMSKARIFALPSYIEGFSRALSEAMASGLPSVVLKKCVSNNYLVSDSKSGISADDSETGFAKQLKYLIGNSDERDKMARNARQYVRRFDAQQIYNSWEEALVESAKKRSKNSEESINILKIRRVQLLQRASSVATDVIVQQSRLLKQIAKELEGSKNELERIHSMKSYKLMRKIKSTAKRATS